MVSWMKSASKRRKFLKDSLLTSIGLLTVPLLQASCEKDTIIPKSSYKGKVLIIGAGAAGLYAGYLLNLAGVDFQILEASDRIGGRLGKLEGFADYPLDLGAQWLHGKKSMLGDLIQENNIAITKDNSDLYFWFNKQIVDSLPTDIWSVFEQENLPDISFEEFAIQSGFGEDYKYIVEAIAGDQGADASRISAYWNIKEEEEWSSGEADFKFKGTFFDVLSGLIADPIKDKITLNAAVNSINYEENSIEVIDHNQHTYFADKVILTVPISILKEESIGFIPPLAANKKLAIQKIGIDAGMKVFLKFRSKFYHENIIGGKISAAYADEKEGKTGEDHILMAFVMGDQARSLSALENDQQIIDTLLAELDEMYQGEASTSFLAGHVQDFNKMPFIKGAYSYSSIEIGDSRSIAAESIADRLFFSGEAMNLNGHHQTVHGAMESGELSVIRILEQN